ncbi:MAG TPA: peptide deformylase [Candidatus Acidoferrum sp.]|nr:peptide deformylase [Candidatus Acidoferrum sp.]
MKLRITQYGEPVLRKKGAHIDSITPEIKALAADMLETMYDAHGVGLAAQQVGHALQLCVIDVTGVKDRPSAMKVDGQSVEPEKQMPLVLINPEIKPAGDPVTGPEGCLSFPEVYGDVTRPGEVDVTATDVDGNRYSFRAGGLLAKAVQHEFDHLQGILFIDRMSSVTKDELRAEIDSLQEETKAELKKKR